MAYEETIKADVKKDLGKYFIIRVEDEGMRQILKTKVKNLAGFRQYLNQEYGDKYTLLNDLPTEEVVAFYKAAAGE